MSDRNSNYALEILKKERERLNEEIFKDKYFITVDKNIDKLSQIIYAENILNGVSTHYPSLNIDKLLLEITNIKDIVFILKLINAKIKNIEKSISGDDKR